MLGTSKSASSSSCEVYFVWGFLFSFDPLSTPQAKKSASRCFYVCKSCFNRMLFLPPPGCSLGWGGKVGRGEPMLIQFRASLTFKKQTSLHRVRSRDEPWRPAVPYCCLPSNVRPRNQAEEVVFSRTCTELLTVTWGAGSEVPLGQSRRHRPLVKQKRAFLLFCSSDHPQVPLEND